MIPPGWAFAQQNSTGRLFPRYGVPVSASVTSLGLTNYLIDHGFDIVDLEPVLIDHLQMKQPTCGDCTDLLYLAHDGHWTAETHALISNQLR
jgi:hypothetical protein